MQAKNSAVGKLQDELARLADSSGRRAPTLIGAVKTRSAAEIQSALAAGLQHLGENYLQEAQSHQAQVGGPGHADGPIWHFIGAIQTNKTKAIAQGFDWVHTLARAKVARRLSSARIEITDRPLQVLIQVNLDGEDTKDGVAASEIAALADVVINDCPGLALRGLMAIPAPATDYTTQLTRCTAVANALTELQAHLGAAADQVDVLSMGMSSDLAAAIAAGATHVRIGTALFGPRPPKA